MTMFGRLNSDGTLTNMREISQGDLMKCPFFIFVADHYRADGSCKCSNAAERTMMMREWGYTADAFDGVPLID